jgi:AcrR family transcriptional regulator
MRKTTNSIEEPDRRPQTARNWGIGTKAKLLDAAERLFSDKGFEAVSHRDIARAAAVNVAAVNYHFGSKHEFIRAVIKREVIRSNARRLAALARAERELDGAPVPTDNILEAFLGPAVEEPNGRFESLLWIGPAASPYRDYFISLMAPVLDRFARALRRSSPQRSDEDCHWYIYISLTVLAFRVSRPRFLPGLSTSLGKTMDAKVITRRITQFVCGWLNGQPA